MKRKEFEEQMKQFKIGDWLTLDLQGPYGQYRVSGYLVKVEYSQVHLDIGDPHSHEKLVKISGA